MRERPDSNDDAAGVAGDASAALEELLYAAIEAHADGADAGLAALLALHPDQADLIRARLERLCELGLLGAQERARAPERLEQLGGFRLLERIGEGGMGLVWIAEEVALGRRVALKMVRPEHVWFRETRERFRREVEAVARLQHPGIVPVYAFGEEGGVPFFTMELVDGCTLADLLRALRGRDPRTLSGVDLARAIQAASPLREPGPPAREREARATGSPFEALSWSDACVAIARQVAEALDYAHGRGLVHRDVKPSNIALTRSGRSMLLDFGLARSESTDRMTRSGSQPGSLPYMSPEQIRGDAHIDARTDVYSLGVTLYELLTLTHAFASDSAEDLRRQVLAGEFDRPRVHHASIPWDVETVCLKAMAREPHERYARADDLARDFTNIIARRPIEARRAGVLLRLLRWSQRHPQASASMLVATPLVLAALVGIAWIERRGRATEQELRGRADANAAIAEDEKRQVLRLSDVRRLGDLELEAERLWPAVPERTTAYEAWLERARALVSRLELHRATLIELEALDGATRDADGTWRFVDLEQQWQHDTLAELIRGLERISEPLRGLIAALGARLEFARTIDERSTLAPAVREQWQHAQSSIADRDQCPGYAGLALAPQRGLVPIGRDPTSGLWEFAHLQTGAPPTRAASGRVQAELGSALVFVLIPAGRFRMGSIRDAKDPEYDAMAEDNEAPAHEVALDAFFLAKYPMTLDQWLRFTGESPSPKRDDQHQQLHPVVNVSWERAQAVMHQLGIALPTEAQWEYACRAGTRTPWWTGAQKESLRGAANLLDATVGRQENTAGRPFEVWLDDGYNLTSPVDAFRANPFGLHDMTGNVKQLCRDAWANYTEPVRAGDGERIVRAAGRYVVRGSSCSSLAFYARSAPRESATPQFRDWRLGLRPSRSIDP